LVTGGKKWRVAFNDSSMMVAHDIAHLIPMPAMALMPGNHSLRMDVAGPTMTIFYDDQQIGRTDDAVMYDSKPELVAVTLVTPGLTAQTPEACAEPKAAIQLTRITVNGR
jgi:hypothetical protein